MPQVIVKVDNKNKKDQPSHSSGLLFALLTTCLMIGAGILAHYSFVFSQTILLWNTDHYSFFPIAIAAFVWLVWERLRDEDVVLAGKMSTQTVVYFIINLCLIGLATVAGSIWLGWVSFLFFIWSVAHFLLAPNNMALIRSPFLVLLLIIPLPLNLDIALVIQLQKIATAQGSLLLDYFGVLHSVSGVAIRLPEKLFLIDDACSGIHSLFSALTTMLVYAVYRHYGIIRIAATLLQTLFWVLVANSIRVFFIVYAFTKWDAGLESGWRHQAVGVASYLAILLMAMSTDQIIRYIFPPYDEEDDSMGRRKRGFRWFFEATEWFYRPFGMGANVIFFSSVLAGFLLIGFNLHGNVLGKQNAVQTTTFDGKLAFTLTEKDLPQEINGWKQTGFEVVNRNKSDLFGANSMIWTYENNGVIAQFSIDGGYPSFHDLWFCYSSVGWNLRHSSNVKLNGSVGDNKNAIATELQLYQGADEQAYILFTCVDSIGNIVEPPPPAETFVRNLLNRLQSGSLLNKEKKQIALPVFQFQAFTHSHTEYFAHEQSGIRDFFSALREVASQRMIMKKENKHVLKVVPQSGSETEP